MASSGFAVVAIWLAAEFLGIDQSTVSRDPIAVMRAPVWTGALSNLGIVVWVVGASIAIFTALSEPVRSAPSSLLLASGLYTSLLALDDLYLVHEKLAPVLLGVPENAVFALYGVLGLVLVARHWRVIRETTVLPAVVAMIGFAASLGLDFLGASHYLEDAPKFIAIVAIACYQIILAVDVRRGRFTVAAPP